LTLPDFLPGRLSLVRGTRRDYLALARFHYRAVEPATWAGVWAVRYADAHDERTVGVGVLSYPCACCRGRETHFGLAGRPYREKLAFANANLRTISRLAVHPRFRGLGLATALVARMRWECPTRWIEVTAVMGRAHRLFERCGLARVEIEGWDKAYFIGDCPTVEPAGVGVPVPHCGGREGMCRLTTLGRATPIGQAGADVQRGVEG